MKFEIAIKVDVEVETVVIQIPYDVSEDREWLKEISTSEEFFEMEVYVETGQIKNWSFNEYEEISLNPRDSGTYILKDDEGDNLIMLEQEPVPNELIVGEYGDTIDLIIDKSGLITNWHKNPTINDFSHKEEE